MTDRKITIAIIVLVLLAVGYYWYAKRNNLPYIPTTTQTIDDKGVTVGVESSGDFQVKSIPVAAPTSTIADSQLPSPPEYRRTFTYPAYFDAGARAITDKNISEQQAAIDKDKTNLDAWIELGNLYNLVKDFEGARIMWEYAINLNTNYFVAYANLGTLYMSDLRDFAKAEANLKKAIAVDKTQIPVYRSLYEVYRYGLKNDAKAKATLQSGISANPGTSQDLKYLLDNYDEV